MFGKAKEGVTEWSKGLLEKVALAVREVQEVAKSVTDAIGGFFYGLIGGIDKGLGNIFG